MAVLLDFMYIMEQLLYSVWQASNELTFAATAIGLILGGLIWWVAYLVARHINLEFSFRIQHYICCSLAAILTFIFTLLFFSSQYSASVADDMVLTWEDSLYNDNEWKDKTFIRAYEAVYKLKDSKTGKQLEDFAGRPYPGSQKESSIPTTNDLSVATVSKVYADSVVSHFRESCPFLSKILWADSENSKEIIEKDVKRVFSDIKHSYDPKDAIKLAGKNIRNELKVQVPRVVFFFRIILSVTFIIILLINIGILAWTSYKDIKLKF